MLTAEWNASPLNEKQQKKVLSVVSQELKLKKKNKVSVAFILPQQIKNLNRDYRGKNKVTDVLSFPLKNCQVVGEILICLTRAKKQAKRYKHSMENEVIILLVHGLLHLFGFDHLKKKDAGKMFFRQKKILKSLKINWSIPEYG